MRAEKVLPPSGLVRRYPEDSPLDAARMDNPSALVATDAHFEGQDERSVVQEMSAPGTREKVTPPSDEVISDEVHVLPAVSPATVYAVTQVRTTAAILLPSWEIARGPQD